MCADSAVYMEIFKKSWYNLIYRVENEVHEYGKNRRIISKQRTV